MSTRPLECVAAAFVASMVLGACGGPAPSEPAVAPQASTVGTGAPAGGKGLHAAGNDPKIVALAEGVLGCPGHGRSDDCPGSIAWDRSDLLDRRAAPTLVAFLEDERREVRALAADSLRRRSDDYCRDEALATRIVAAAEAEQDAELATVLGGMVGHLDVERTGLFDRVAKLAESGVPARRAAVVSNLYHANHHSILVYSLVKQLLHDPEPTVREAAFESFHGARDLEVCDLLAAELKGAAPQATTAALAIANGPNGACATHFDAVLAWVEGRSADAEVPRLTDIVGRLCDDREATVAEEKRGAVLLRRWIERAKLAPYVRAQALQALPKCDVDSAKYARALKADAEELKTMASEVASKPTEATGPAPDVLGPPEPEPPAVDVTAAVKAFSAMAFLAGWTEAPREELRDRFPPGLYRIDGTVVGISAQARGRLQMKLAAGKGSAVVLEFAASQAKAARSRRRGAPAKALCEFRGAEYAGYVTFEKCHWEGSK